MYYASDPFYYTVISESKLRKKNFEDGGVKMIIEQLSSLTVKVSLTKTDLENHNVNFESLENSNKNTKEFVSSVIDEVRLNLGLDLYNEPLYIEAFSCINNGCILYISAIDNSLYEQPDQPEENISEFIILETRSAKMLIRFSIDFLKYFCESHIGSTLYYSDNIFRLIINIHSESYSGILDTAINHGFKYSTDKTLLAYTEEYYSCIFKCNAADKLSGKILF